MDPPTFFTDRQTDTPMTRVSFGLVLCKSTIPGVEAGIPRSHQSFFTRVPQGLGQDRTSISEKSVCAGGKGVGGYGDRWMGGAGYLLYSAMTFRTLLDHVALQDLLSLHHGDL